MKGICGCIRKLRKSQDRLLSMEPITSRSFIGFEKEARKLSSLRKITSPIIVLAFDFVSKEGKNVKCVCLLDSKEKFSLIFRTLSKFNKIPKVYIIDRNFFRGAEQKYDRL